MPRSYSVPRSYSAPSLLQRKKSKSNAVGNIADVQFNIDGFDMEQFYHNNQHLLPPDTLLMDILDNQNKTDINKKKHYKDWEKQLMDDESFVNEYIRFLLYVQIFVYINLFLYQTFSISSLVIYAINYYVTLFRV